MHGFSFGPAEISYECVNDIDEVGDWIEQKGEKLNYKWSVKDDECPGFEPVDEDWDCTLSYH